MQSTLRHITAVIAVGFFALSSVCARPVHARTAIDESAVMVGYIYNFMKFVDWPDNFIKQDYIVCILGSNPFGTTVKSLGAKTIRNRRIRVVTDVALEQTKYCHVVFVSRSESGRLMPALLRLRRLPVLSISDIEGFSDKGGVIELVPDGGNGIGFRVSQKSAMDVGLRVSSKLLSMSR